MATFNPTSNKVFHYVGLQSEYASLSSELQKQVIFFCTDTEGVHKGAIIHDGKVYGSQLQVSDIGVINSVSYDPATNKINIILSNGQIKEVTLPLASASTDGLMSKTGFTKLERIETGAQVNVIETLDIEGTMQTITGKNVTLDTYKKTTIDEKINAAVSSLYKIKGTKATITEVLSLTDAVVGDVWNVTAAFTLSSKKYPAGTNVVYIGKGATNEEKWDCLGGTVDLSPYVTSESMNTSLNSKVDKIEGKFLVSNTEITKLVELKSQSELDIDIAIAKKAGDDAQVTANQNTNAINSLKGNVTEDYNSMEKIEHKVKELETSNVWYSVTQ